MLPSHHRPPADDVGITGQVVEIMQMRRQPENSCLIITLMLEHEKMMMDTDYEEEE